MLFFKRAVLREPSKSVDKAIAQDPKHETPDYALTMIEYRTYVQALQKMGIELNISEPDENYPDGNFVEDTHLILAELIIELNPGAPSRAGEPMSLSPSLPNNLPHHRLSKKYTIDGGDILQNGKKIYVGLSSRTQQGAIDELTAVVSPFEYEVIAIRVPQGLHLKSGMTCMLPNHFIIQEAFENILKEMQIKDDQIIYFVVPPEEYFAANVLPANGKIMIPTNCPKTKEYVARFYDAENILEVDTTQARKVDGALTCSSLLFH